MSKIPVSIIGASGYVGRELVRYLLFHPGVELFALTSETFAGKELAAVYPEFIASRLYFTAFQPAQIARNSQVVFLALPHGKSAPLARKLLSLNPSLKIIDLSADFRFERWRIYEKWYKVKFLPVVKRLRKEVVYGLPEFHRPEIAAKSIVANPGCYATAILLGMIPLWREGVIHPSVIVDAKSGISGAGRRDDWHYSFAELNEDLSPYAVANHRHTPEVNEELWRISRREAELTLVPHLVPLERGILANIYCRLKSRITEDRLRIIFESSYRNEPFLKILPSGALPRLKAVANSNRVLIGVSTGSTRDISIIMVALDNLGKGAAGQAVQNLNILLGWEETLGLRN